MITLMRHLFILFLFLAKTAAAQVSATATVDSTHLLIGDQLKLHIEARHPAGVVIEPPVLKQPEGSKVEFLAQSSWDTLEKGTTFRLRKELVFTAWDTGYQQVPALPFVYQQNGSRDTVFTKEIPVRVEAPAIDSTLADIKPIIGEPAKLEDYLPYIGGLLALLLIALLVMYFRKRKSRQEPAPAPAVFLLPHEIALQKLEALKKQKLWQQGEVKAYHSELTYIVREYLESRYGIAALENTTGEILDQMRKLTLTKEVAEKLDTMLHTADLVKFAKARPAADVHELAMKYAEEFVLASKPVQVLFDETATEDV